jgi:hypothetical protein
MRSFASATIGSQSRNILGVVLFGVNSRPCGAKRVMAIRPRRLRPSGSIARRDRRLRDGAPVRFCGRAPTFLDAALPRRASRPRADGRGDGPRAVGGGTGGWIRMRQERTARVSALLLGRIASCGSRRGDRRSHAWSADLFCFRAWGWLFAVGCRLFCSFHAISSVNRFAWERDRNCLPRKPGPAFRRFPGNDGEQHYPVHRRVS